MTLQPTPERLPRGCTFKRLSRWLATLLLAAGTLPALAAVPDTERQVLIDLYNGTNGSSWTTKTNWLTGDPCANAWHGIGCDATGTHVRWVRLDDNNLVGTLPASLTALTDLIYVNVAKNQLVGSIPSLSGMAALREFYAHQNQLTGSIPSLSGLPKLSVFVVSENQLTGSIPSLSGLPALGWFGAETNQLTGSIPDLKGLTGL